LRSRDGPFVVAALTVRSEIPLIVLGKIFADQSAEEITAICWKAGMTIKFALALQLKMTRITPTNIFGARNPDKFPLSPEELNWKLAFYINLTRN
jgi:hypothetical protein